MEPAQLLARGRGSKRRRGRPPGSVIERRLREERAMQEALVAAEAPASKRARVAREAQLAQRDAQKSALASCPATRLSRGDLASLQVQSNAWSSSSTPVFGVPCRFARQITAAATRARSWPVSETDVRMAKDFSTRGKTALLLM